MADNGGKEILKKFHLEKLIPVLEEYGHQYPPSGHHDYHGSPSAPEADYEAPSSYHSSSQQEDHHGHHGHSGQSGLLVIKKIPHDGRDFSASNDSPVKVPSFKPIETGGPSFATIFGKFFKASTSLDPHQPVGFGDTAPAATIETESHVYHDSDPVEPTGTGLKIPSTNYGTPTGSGIKIPPTNYGTPTDTGFKSESHVYHDSDPVQPTGTGLKIPSTSYGTPFEEEPQFLHEYGAATQKRPVVVKHPNSLITNPTLPSKLNSKPVNNFKAPQPTASALTANNYFEGNLDQLNVPPSTGASNFYIGLPEELTPELLDMYRNYNEPAPAKPSANTFLPTPLVNDSPPTSSTFFRQNRPNKQIKPVLNKQHNPFDVVRSISYELGPNGPKRLTRRQT